MTKILLVEDDKSLREIYGVRLLAEGYDIVSAGDGEEALAMAIKERPELIVSDVMMPKISGFDMLDILRSTTETRDIKVIMMTALSSDDQRARGEQLGADRYLVKSQVGIEDVVRTVHEVLGDQQAAPSSPAPQTAPVAPQEQQQVAPAPAVTIESLPPQPTVLPPADQAYTPVAPQEQQQVAPAPVEATLPQPTAPFSSPRPATLGERIIHPLESAAPTTSESVSSQIAQELKAMPDAVQSVPDLAEEAPSVAPQTPVDQFQSYGQQPTQEAPAQAENTPYEETPRPTNESSQFGQQQ